MSVCKSGMSARGLAHASGRGLILHDVHVSLTRRLGETGNLVVIEVRLFDRAILGRDFAVAGDAGTIYRRAFKLRPGAIGIDDGACVDDVIHSRNRDVAVGYRIQSGDEQWLVYRSLAPVANRSVMGHNTYGSFVCGRIKPNGDVKDILTME